MNNDFSSASERADLFQAAMVKALKLCQYSSATNSRFRETMEAIQALPKAERKPHLGALVDLFKLKIDRMLNAVSACSEFLRCADQAPDFAKANQEKFIAEVRSAHQENIEILKGLSA